VIDPSHGAAQAVPQLYSPNMWGARRTKTVLAVLVGLILCGILRSAIATRLDSLDIDEAYHITAGVTYFRLGDYRLNPEHPPLIKLWVGAFLTHGVFKTFASLRMTPS
jgi:hypothetical protein